MPLPSPTPVIKNHNGKTIRRGTLDLGYSSLAASRRQSIGEEPDYKQVVMIMVNRKKGGMVLLIFCTI